MCSRSMGICGSFLQLTLCIFNVVLLMVGGVVFVTAAIVRWNPDIILGHSNNDSIESILNMSSLNSISTAPVPMLVPEKAPVGINNKNNNSNSISQLMTMSPTPAPAMKAKLLPSPNELLIDTDSFATTQTTKPISSIPYDSNPFGAAGDDAVCW